MKPKNAAELKRFLIGKTLLLVERHGEKIDPPARRPVLKINSVEIILDHAGKKSYLRWPPATLLTIDENGFSIHNPGTRSLDDYEKELMAGEPRDAKQEEIDAISDGSTMWRRRCRYYEYDHPDFQYLHGTKKHRGCHLKTNNATGPDGKPNPPVIIDDKIKGPVCLRYIFE